MYRTSNFLLVHVLCLSVLAGKNVVLGDEACLGRAWVRTHFSCAWMWTGSPDVRLVPRRTRDTSCLHPDLFLLDRRRLSLERTVAQSTETAPNGRGNTELWFCWVDVGRTPIRNIRISPAVLLFPCAASDRQEASQSADVVL